LEELSKVIVTINNSIKERKTTLAPQIKELRALRQNYQEVEMDYTEKKTQYDNATIGMQKYVTR
jgi:intraflagellar transport protein 81